MQNTNEITQQNRESGANILLEAATPEIYKRNAFRVLELPVTATPRDIKKRQQMLEMARKTGVQTPSGPAPCLPLNPPPDEDDVRQAIARLQDPERRLIDELFWFWPNANEPGSIDGGLGALTQGDAGKAEAEWRQQTDDYVSLHNLAVLNHLMVLETDDSKNGLWEKTYDSWKKVVHSEGLWRHVARRINDLDDPRLTPEVAGRIRSTLPASLLLINAKLGVKAAEQGDLQTAEYHGKTIRNSGWPADEALGLAVQPVRDRIELLCKAAEPAATADPVHGDRVAEGVMEQTRPLLAALDILLSPDHAIRIHAHDRIALCARFCQITFGNKTENWTRSIWLLEKALSIASSESARNRIENDLPILRENLAAGSFWCGEGYFELPEEVLAKAEEARTKADHYQYDEAISILTHVLTQAGQHNLTEKQIHLLRNPLADVLNRRWLSEHNPAMDRYNAPIDFLRELAASGRQLDFQKHMNQQLLRNINLSYGLNPCCDKCANTIFGQYTKLTYLGSAYNICFSCGLDMDRQKDRKKTELSSVIEKTASYLLLAAKLDPDKAVIQKNLSILRDLALEVGTWLKDPNLVLLQSGLAVQSELVRIAEVYTPDSPVHQMAMDALKSLDPLEAVRIRKVHALKKRKAVLRQMFKVAAGLAAVVLLFIGIFTASYSFGFLWALQSANEVGIIDHDTLMEKMIQEIRTRPGSSKIDVIQALGEMGAGATSAFPAMLDALKDSDETVRLAAVENLQKINPAPRDLLPPLLAAMTDPHESVRQAAAKGLGALKSSDRDVVQSLRKGLKDPNWQVMEASALALGQIGPGAKRAIPDLMEWLDEKNTNSTRATAATALGSMGDAARAVIPALIDLLQHGDFYESPAAARALSKFGPAAKAAIPDLIHKLYSTDGDYPRAASDAICAIGNLSKEDWGQMVHALRYLSGNFGGYALKVFDKFGPEAKSAVPSLIEIVKDETSPWYTRSAMISAIGAIGPSAKDAVPAIIKALKDPNMDDWGKASAAEALVKMGPAAKAAIPALKDAAKTDSYTLKDTVDAALREIELNP